MSPVTGPICKVCEVRLRDKHDHTAHVSSLPHHVKLAESWKSVGTHYCKLCEVTCRGLEAIEKHFLNEQHLAAIAKCRETIKNKEKKREEKKKEKKNESANISAKFAQEIQSRAEKNIPTTSEMDRRRYNNHQSARGDFSPRASHHSHHSYDRHSASFDERGMDYRRRPPPPLLGPQPPPPHPHHMDRRDYQGGYERPVSFYADATAPHLPGFRHSQYGQWAEGYQQPPHGQQGNWSGEVPPPPPGVSVPQHPALAAREQSTSGPAATMSSQSQFRRNVDERKSYHGRTEREQQASPGGGGQKIKEEEKRDRPKPSSRPASACSNHSEGSSSSGRKKTAVGGQQQQQLPQKKKSSAAAAAASLLRKATTVKKLKAVVRVGPAAAVAAAAITAPTPGTSAAPAVVLEDKERKWDKIARRAPPDTLRNKSHKRFQERQKKWGLQTADGSLIVDDLGAESSSSSGTEKAKASDDNVSLSSHIWGTGPETQCPDRMKMPTSIQQTPSRSELPSITSSRLRVDDTYMSIAEVRGLKGGGGGGGGERSGKAELIGLMGGGGGGGGGGVGVPVPQSASTPVRVKREAPDMVNSPLSTPEVAAKRPTTLLLGAAGVPGAHDASFSSTASADVTVIPNPAAAPALLNVKQEVVEGIETESAPSPPSLTPVSACPLTGPMPTTREEKMNAMWTLNEMEMKEEAEYARLQDEAKRIMLALTTSQARLTAMKARKQALLQ